MPCLMGDAGTIEKEQRAWMCVSCKRALKEQEEAEQRKRDSAKALAAQALAMDNSGARGKYWSYLS